MTKKELLEKLKDVPDNAPIRIVTLLGRRIPTFSAYFDKERYEFVID